MIKIYFLPLLTIDGTEYVSGIEYIHDAILECTEDPNERKLIMNVTIEEDAWLEGFSLESYGANQEEIDLYNAQVVITPPDPDIERAEELLGTSPAVITMPEIWELLRIFGSWHGLNP